MSRIVKIIITTFLAIFVSACSTHHDQTTDEPSQMVKTARVNTKLGLAYLQQGNVSLAKQKLLTALNQAPEIPDTWYSMAYFQEATNNAEEAQRDYLKAISVAKSKGESENNYGTFLCRGGNYQDAINHFMLATQDPAYLNVAGAYENSGLCALKIPDAKLAKHYFQLALGQDSNSPTSLLELAKLEFHDGNKDHAKQYLELYLKIAPDTSDSTWLSNKLALNKNSTYVNPTNPDDNDGINNAT